MIAGFYLSKWCWQTGTSVIYCCQQSTEKSTGSADLYVSVHGSANSTLNWVIVDCRQCDSTVLTTDTALVKVSNYFCLGTDFAIISLLVL